MKKKINLFNAAVSAVGTVILFAQLGIGTGINDSFLRVIRIVILLSAVVFGIASLSLTIISAKKNCIFHSFI